MVQKVRLLNWRMALRGRGCKGRLRSCGAQVVGTLAACLPSTGAGSPPRPASRQHHASSTASALPPRPRPPLVQGCERSVITYSSLISACEKAGEWKLALQLFEEMRQEVCARWYRSSGCTADVAALPRGGGKRESCMQRRRTSCRRGGEGRSVQAAAPAPDQFPRSDDPAPCCAARSRRDAAPMSSLTTPSSPPARKVGTASCGVLQRSKPPAAFGAPRGAGLGGQGPLAPRPSLSASVCRPASACHFPRTSVCRRAVGEGSGGIRADAAAGVPPRRRHLHRPHTGERAGRSVAPRAGGECRTQAGGGGLQDLQVTQLQLRARSCAARRCCPHAADAWRPVHAGAVAPSGFLLSHWLALFFAGF